MWTSKLAWVVLFAGACTEYEITGEKTEEKPGVDTGFTDTAPPKDTADTAPPADELCNGEDDDGDGDVDEGYPDSDGDGVVDCQDEDCDLEDVTAAAVTVDTTCVAPDVTVTDPWNVTIEWQWTGLSANSAVHNVIMTPIVGNLTDDNGDGTIDDNDTPDIVFVAFPSTSFSGGTLVALDGASGTELWSSTGFSGGGGIAMADVDVDGSPDILAFNTSNYPVMVNASGRTMWTYARSAGSYPQATVADVDGDGNPEVIADAYLLNGATGALKATLNPTSSTPYRMPSVGDLDQDGDQEIILGNTAFDHTGRVLWSASFAGTYGHWSAILDYDGDAEAEVAMVGGGRLAIYDHDGTQRVNVSAGTGQPGAPCVADFDGDGSAEIGWASSGTFNMFELSGGSVWSQRIDDSSGLASCSGYDVDGDGALEVFYADQATFYIFDGARGTTRYSQGGHASGTLWEYPSIADVDNDGSAEAVIGSNNYWMSGWGGITVFGHNGSGWQKSGPTWHTHDFAVTNINSDASVPATPDPWWQIYNVYRARPTVDDAAIDLQGEVVDVCFSGCSDDSYAQIVVQASNTGGLDSDIGVGLSLYRLDGTAETLLDTVTLGASIPSGESTDGVVFELTVGDFGSDAMIIRVDDDGSGGEVHTECDESNNEDAWLTDLPCR